ncbi:MAG TPA: nucleoside triphosphate pyrophosphohydrolase family protein [Candidatus Saccharimonadales bacterium]|nr:nucleoside triphosphate pyrophosphohydrolase family protein [Candidatus Saccharimonadales bacterium]
MTFDEYQKQALTTAHITYDDPVLQNSIWAMGVGGEAGEVLEKWKKIVAYKNGKISEEDLAELAKEMADVVWYVAILAHSLGLSLDDIMQKNLSKLADRKQRGVITGKGDNR